MTQLRLNNEDFNMAGQSTLFILRRDYLERLKELAYWETKTIKAIIDKALPSYLEEETFFTLEK